MISNFRGVKGDGVKGDMDEASELPAAVGSLDGGLGFADGAADGTGALLWLRERSAAVDG